MRRADELARHLRDSALAAGRALRSTITDGDAANADAAADPDVVAHVGAGDEPCRETGLKAAEEIEGARGVVESLEAMEGGRLEKLGTDEAEQALLATTQAVAVMFETMLRTNFANAAAAHSAHVTVHSTTRSVALAQLVVDLKVCVTDPTSNVAAATVAPVTKLPQASPKQAAVLLLRVLVALGPSLNTDAEASQTKGAEEATKDATRVQRLARKGGLTVRIVRKIHYVQETVITTQSLLLP